MTTPVAPPAMTPDVSGAVARRPPAEDVAAPAPAPKPATASNDAASAEIPADFDTRLVIEEDKATKTFIYKTLDRRTGEVIQQFPREQVLRLHQEPGYQPGSVLRART